MQTEQADARLSFFELAASGDVMKRLEAWALELFATIDKEPGVECQRLALLRNNIENIGVDFALENATQVELPLGKMVLAILISVDFG